MLERSASEPSRGMAKDGGGKVQSGPKPSPLGHPHRTRALAVSPASWRSSGSLPAVASMPRGTRCPVHFSCKSGRPRPPCSPRPRRSRRAHLVRGSVLCRRCPLPRTGPFRPIAAPLRALLHRAPAVGAGSLEVTGRSRCRRSPRGKASSRGGRPHFATRLRGEGDATFGQYARTYRRSPRLAGRRQLLQRIGRTNESPTAAGRRRFAAAADRGTRRPPIP